ncbi:disulfide bond formation protein B [Planococcus glaciei]|uniref:disulfide bond formation protein B n=1 Tax=Planococcus glaciei TaxID=459472 RepID=UPI001FE29447
MATLGSLYFSEIKGFIPCDLCWFQRIFMYPLEVFLGIATFQNDWKIASVTPAVDPYRRQHLGHALHGTENSRIRRHPSLCEWGSCSAEYINWLGFITIPFLALIAFLMITIAMVLLIVKKNN